MIPVCKNRTDLFEGKVITQVDIPYDLSYKLGLSDKVERLLIGRGSLVCYPSHDCSGYLHILVHIEDENQRTTFCDEVSDLVNAALAIKFVPSVENGQATVQVKFNFKQMYYLFSKKMVRFQPALDFIDENGGFDLENPNDPSGVTVLESSMTDGTIPDEVRKAYADLGSFMASYIFGKLAMGDFHGDMVHRD